MQATNDTLQLYASNQTCIIQFSIPKFFDFLQLDDDIDFNRIDFLALQIVRMNAISILNAVHPSIAYGLCGTFS